MQHDTLLDDVKSHFDHWRATRTKRGKIPDYLWDKVRALIGHYSLTDITETLSINSNQMRNNLNVGATFNFVEVSNSTKISPSIQPSISPADHTQTCSIELHHASGVILKINALPIPSLPTIITQFIG